MRYHKWILQQLRKEREMESQEWEFDFLNPPETVVCTACGQVHLEAVSIPKTVWNGRKESTYQYCGKDCLWAHYLKRLRANLNG